MRTLLLVMIGASFSLSMGRTAHAGSPALQRLGVVVSVDPQRQVPTFVWASRDHQPRFTHSHGGPEAAAMHYLAAYAPLYRLGAAVVRAARVHRVHDMGRGGILVVLRQQVEGVEVLRSELKLLLDRHLSLVALGGNLHAGAADPRLQGAWITSAAERLALTRAASHLFGGTVVPMGGGRPRHGWLCFPLRADNGSPLTARSRPVYFPLPGRLVPAFQVELRGSGDNGPEQSYEYVLAADDGRVLLRRNLVAHEAFTYRVWADAADPSTPYDGPHADFTPHPAAAPDLSTPDYAAGQLVTLEGFNTNPDGLPDPWLTADATETRGNNVDSYMDLAWPTSYLAGADQRGQLSATRTFDYVYAPAEGALQTDDQRQAAVVQLFYTVNWLHDFFYDSGFDEAAGNAQADNYGRGGSDGDPLVARVEGKYTGLRNNASMSTPADGESPTMRMGIWRTDDPARVEALSALWGAGTARFGATSFDVSAEVVLVNDATAPEADGCEPLLNAAALANRIALVERGQCSFVDKVRRAQDASALAVLVIQSDAVAEPTSMGTGGSADIGDIVLPVLMISYAHGEALKSALTAGSETARLVVSAAGVQGALDNTVVAHEWGHYLHHRLQHCATHQCAALSEGWADFTALLALGRQGDDPEGTYATGGYSVSHRNYAYYYGVRRVAYSVEPTRNNLSFRHISDGEPLPTDIPLQSIPVENSEVHNAGEIWASMLWEAWVALWRRSLEPSPAYDWTAARRRMADYMVTGMALAPVDPTYTEQRDGVLAAALAADADDFGALAEAFARRGAGTCAVSPSRDSTELLGVQEDFAVSPGLRILSVRLDDAVISCDNDGLLDGQEVGHLTVEVQNTGTTTLQQGHVTVSATAAELHFPDATEATLPPIEPFETGEATVLVTLDAEAGDILHVPLRVVVSHPDACDPEVTSDTLQRLNVDDFPSNSATDDVESETPVWDLWGGSDEDPAWVRAAHPGDPTNHFWHGRNVTYHVDTSLVSPRLQVSPARDLVIRFTHRYRFHDVDGERDGGVLEISPDDGATWQDVSDFVDPSYPGTIHADGNPLTDRPAWVGQSAGWPDAAQVTLNLGRALGGQPVRIRFRLTTGWTGGAHGWELDDIGFEGLTNTPFRRIIADELSCDPPLADAGPDQTVAVEELVALDGTASRDPNGASLHYSWTQTAGPAVELTDADGPTPVFTAPAVDDASAVLVFELAVESTSGRATDSVQVVVRARGKAGGCHCRSTDAPTGLAWCLLLAGLLWIRRRRTDR